jgi:hypothetical protein
MNNKFSFLSLIVIFIIITSCSTTDESLPSTLPTAVTPPNPVVVVTPAPVPAPTFTSFSPQSAFLGDVVTIYGTNLDKNIKNLSVSIGGLETTVLSANATSATIKVPDDLNNATAKIKLTSGATTITSTEDFHLSAPIINSISYSKGFAGQQVTIKGKGFRNSFHIGQISFNGVDIDASLTNVGNSELFMTVPKGLNSGKYPISVTIAGMKTTAPDLFEVVIPTITSITPITGKQYTNMTIAGTNLKDIYGIGVPTLVSFTDAKTNTGSTTGNVLISEENKIEVTVPRLEVGHSYKVKILVVKSSVEATQTFTYTE